MWKTVTPLNAPNETNNFYPADENWVLTQMPFKASEAVEEGSLVGAEISSNDVTGNLAKLNGTENAVGWDFVGILAEPITATDGDYATAGKLKGVRVPVTPYAKAYFTVGAGTFTAADVFRTVEIHSDKKSLAVDTKGKGARIMELISSTKGVCRFSLPETETA